MSEKRSILFRRNAAVRLRIFIDMSLFVAPVDDTEGGGGSYSADKTDASVSSGEVYLSNILKVISYI